MITTKRVLYVLLILSFIPIGCSDNSNKIPSNNINTYFQKIRTVYGGDKIFNSRIQFSSQGLDYTVERKGHLSNYDMRNKRDEDSYHATYKNGFIEYYINGILQDDKTYSRKFFDVKLDAFIYTTFIPHILVGTDIIVDKLEDVTISNKKHHVFYIHTKQVQDVATSKFYLYVDPKTYYISYLAQDHIQSSPKHVFKRFYNYQNINGITFADYYPFQPHKDNIPLDSLYTYFDQANLQELRPITYSNIKVDLKND